MSETKIQELTPEQEAQCEVYKNNSMEIGLSVARMTYEDKKHVSDLVLKMYDYAHKDNENISSEISPGVPIIRLFVHSPKQATKVINIINNKPNLLQGYTDLDHNDEFVANILENESLIDGKMVNQSVCFSGNHETSWIQFYNYFKEVLGIEYNETIDKKFELIKDLSMYCSWIYTNQSYAVICERPSEINMENGVIHNTEGPAIKYSDGFTVYAVDGHTVPEYVIEKPEEITIEKIEQMIKENVETSRIMIDIYGPSKYMQETGAKVLDTDILNLDGSSVRMLVEDKNNQRWFIGSDGSTGRVYHMPVESNINTCTDAHAQISGFDADSRVDFES